MNIGIDIDGVLADFTNTYIKVVNKKYNINLRYEDIREHGLYKVMGIPPNEAWADIAQCIEDDPPVIEGAKKVIDSLYGSNRIIIITARGRELEGTTKEWLQGHGIKYHKLYFSDEGMKGEIEPLDILIEDNISELIDAIGKVDHLFLMSHPWNISLNVKNYYTRVNSWEEIHDNIKGLQMDKAKVNIYP